MMRRLPLLFGILVFAAAGALHAAEPAPPKNLLLNPDLGFHSFSSSRTGQAGSFQSGAVPAWDEDAYGDVTVYRGARTPGFRTRFPADGVVAIHPGKRFSQFFLLAEVGLDHGDHVSLSAFGHQAAPDALQATIYPMRLDSATGDWSPADFGQADKRRFPRYSRGELIRGPGFSATSGAPLDFETKIENAEIVGAFTEDANNATDQPNTIGLTVEFVNRSKDKDVWIYAPCLSRSATAFSRLPEARPMPQLYRGIPRTMQKLWRGEPLHILVMGSSIDRGSANPPQYLYDEDPKSPTYKQPLTGTNFEGEKVGHPEWNDYIGWWQHYFMYGGRLRRALMQKFNYPMEKLLLNTMAADGSCISEAHSGFADYASLARPPDAGANGHRAGKTWQQLYPSLFERPEGPRPDLVIWGSGANEKVDGADEIAAFEGAIRWFQRHYPDTEFLFCMWQNRESYTPNTGHLAELALRYGIPNIDLGRTLDQVTRHCNSYALVPRDGHPQASGHYLWSKQLESAFDAVDPIEFGMPQRHLPERVNRYTPGWEGEVRTYTAGPRLRNGSAFVLDDVMVNLWATSKDEKVGIRIDEKPHMGSGRSSFARRDLRNSSFATGLLSLGDRHVLEVTGTDAQITAVDAKTVSGRQFVGVDSPRWKLATRKPEPFVSEWGAPYGSRVVVLAAGESAEIDLAGTDFSVAYADQPNAGVLRAEVDGELGLTTATNVQFTTAAGTKIYMENRKALHGKGYGGHSIRITALGGPVALLGVFSYDLRSNRANERVERGAAFPGETVQFSAPYRTRPVVVCTGGLTAAPADVKADSVTFKGTGAGGFEVVGE